MNDTSILQKISDLSDEELELEEHHAKETLNGERLKRLQEIEVELDQCWDLLRQRRARRMAGQNPEDTSVRSADVVEHYLQ